MSLHVEQVDPQLEPILRRWWETGRDSWGPDRVAAGWPTWDATRRAMRTHDPEFEMSLYLAYQGDAVVGFGTLVLPLRENPHLAFLDAGVLPAHRRRGHGTTLVGDLQQRVRDRGRHTVVVEGYAPLDGTAPCRPFAAALGYEVAHVETVKHQAASTHRAVRQELAPVVDAARDRYHLLGWDTACPEEHVADLCRMLGGFNAQVPLGQLALEDSAWTPARLRAWEARCLAVGRHSFTAAAVKDGCLVGTSGVRVDDGDPVRGSVGITLVAPEHRGHRLGLALKLAATDLALQHFPDLERIETTNADTNTHMNAVNERLGYRPVERLLELQRRL